MFNFSFIQQEKSIYEKESLWDVVIIGGGPAGINALLYAKRKGLKALLVSYELGGQLNNTDLVDNYLGIPKLSGEELTKRFAKHLEEHKAFLLTNIKVQSLERYNQDFIIKLDNQKVLKTKTVILATGGNPRKLGVTGELDYQAKGVSYCTICDAPFFKDKKVVVAGGGNSAAESVVDLLKWAEHVTVVHRSQFRADKVLLDEFINDSRVTIHLETQITEIKGNDKLTTLILFDKENQIHKSLKTDGLFVSIGVIPNTSLVKDLVTLNDKLEVVVDNYQRSSVKGLYAVGDVTDQLYKQIIISAAEGAKAVLDIDRYLTKEYIKEH